MTPDKLTVFSYLPLLPMTSTACTRQIIFRKSKPTETLSVSTSVSVATEAVASVSVISISRCTASDYQQQESYHQQLQSIPMNLTKYHDLYIHHASLLSSSIETVAQ